MTNSPGVLPAVLPAALPAVLPAVLPAALPAVLQNLEKKILSKYPESPVKIVNYYCKIRLRARIKYLNQKLQEKRNSVFKVRSLKQKGQFLN